MATTGVASAAGSEGELLTASGWAALALLVAGTVLLMVSVELLIHALVRTGIRFGVSPFLLAVVFSGWEFDNVAFGAFTGFREMQHVAFGLAIGNAVSIFGLTLAVGALLFPFEIDVPRDYLALTVAAPALLLTVLGAGGLTPLLSGGLIATYVVVFAYIVRQERGTDRQFVRSNEVWNATTTPDGYGSGNRELLHRRLVRHDWFWPAMLVVALAGIVLGAEASASAVEGVLETWDLSGTFVGVTLITVLYTIDDLLLIVEPLRLGYERVAVGGVIGSLLFFVTANVGLVGLVGSIQFDPSTLLFHLGSLFLFTALSVLFLWRGRMDRRRGAVLFGLYVVYLLVNVRYLATVPVGG